MLFLSLAPPITALIGWLVLDERLTATNWLGMALTLGGVVWVVRESPAAPGASGRRFVFTLRGGLSAAAAATAQAVAMVLAKRGLLAGAVSSAGATQIRLIAGLLCFLVLTLALRRQAALAAAMARPRIMGILLLGAAACPVLGVMAMMVAVRHISTGLAQTYLSLSPVMIIPFMRRIYGERVGPHAVLGALVACLGVALLFVR
jgi:drug/metabolite transporter (DMT)-like permease